VRRLETLSEDHKAVRNHVDQIGENVKQAGSETAETVARQVASRESFQAHAEALDAQLSGLAAAQQQSRGNVDGLKELIRTVAEDVTIVAREQATLHNAVETGSEESLRRLETLSDDHRAVRNCVDQLGEIVKHGSAEAVELISQRVTSRETFQVHAEALDSQLSGLAGAQEQLRGHIDGLKGLLEAVAGDVTNVAREQANLHEAVENRGAESVRRMETLSEESARCLETLSEDHKNVHNHLNRLGDNVKHASSEAVETLARRVASRESFEAHTEVLDAQFSGLTAAQEQFSGHITGLRELMQVVAGDVSNVAREQANLHEAVETGGEECARRMEALSEESSHRFEMLSEESGRRIETLSEESAGLLETLSQDHAHVHNHLDQLCENVKQASSEAAEQVAQRVASRESFQAHAEMLDVQLSGLATAQEQLRSHVCGLREITQAVAGDVTSVARGQATLHEAVESRGRDSGRRLETLSDDHRNVQKHVDQLGETVRQVTADAVKLVAMRVASRESFEAHTEALDTQLSGLAATQEQLRGHVHGLKGLIQAVAGNVTDVAREQIDLHEAVEAKGEETVRHVATLSEDSVRRFDELSEDHRDVHDHLDRLGADVKQAGSETAETLLEESVRRFEALSEDHKNAHDHLDRLGADVKQAGSETAETLLEESVRRLEALSEDHKNAHDHLDRLGADVKQAGSEAAETLSQEAVRRFDALSKDHRHVNDHLDQLGADVRQASCEAVETLAQRVTSCESFEVHTEALDAQLSGLAAAQEQLRGHIAGLKELVQSVGGDVSNVAREQVNLHEAVEAKGAESARHIETLSEELDRRLETLWGESAGRLETLSADHVKVHNHLGQLGEDVKQATETLSEESVRHLEVLSKDHRNVHNHLDRLDESIKHASAETVDQVTHQVASRESFQAHAEALDAQLSGLAAAQKQLRGHVDGLRDLMQAVAGDVTNVAREQATLHEAVENRGEESAHRLETLSAGQKATHVQLDHLGETVRNVSADAVEMFAERVASRESFQAHVEALDGQLSGLAAVQEQLRGRVDNLREEMQAVAGKQTTLHEAVETGDAESARRLEKLSDDHRAVQDQVEQISETVKQVSDEAVELVTQRVAIGESLQDAHAEALDVQLTGLSAAQEQLRGHVDSLRELMQAVSGDVTNVAREQTTLHDAIETTGAESARGFETLSQDHTNVRNHLDQLGEDVKQASSEAVETLSEDHRNVHNHLDQLGEDVKQAGSEAVETLSEDHRNVHKQECS